MFRAFVTALGIVTMLIGITLFAVSDVYVRVDKWSEQYRPVQLPLSWHVKDHYPFFTVAIGLCIVILAQAMHKSKAAAAH